MSTASSTSSTRDHLQLHLCHARGELRKELISTLRHAHKIEDRQFPGHWEGDLIKGEGKASAVRTLVERTSRLVMLVKLPEFKPASVSHFLQGFTDKLLRIAQPMRLSMTYDQGREMSMYKKLSE